jgi:alpha-N-arabinofuranosidase
VQQIFSRNVGTRVLPVSPQAGSGLYSVASLDERTHELVVTAVNTTAQVRAAEIKFDGITPAGTAQVTTLQSADLKAENSFDQPTAVAPVTTSINVKATFLSVQLPAQSVTVYRIPLK